jgi:hypothetical protein
MLAFCNAVNRGEEPRDSPYGDFLLGEGQEKDPVQGLPVLPEPWPSYLLKGPAEGVVTEVLPELRAKVRLGRKRGLLPGMVLLPTEGLLFSDQVVESVGGGDAVVRALYPDGMFREIRVGDVVGTRKAVRRATAAEAP